MEPTQTRYLPPTPAAERLVQWPAAFGTRFAVMVDTEEEFDWGAPLSRASRSVTAIAALPALHHRFAERGVPVVYLVDHPVAVSPRATDTISGLLEDGISSVGAHLHPWVTPPDDEPVTPETSFAGNLSPRLEGAKLDVLGAAIASAFGRPPRIYRAGRYGIGPETLRLLAERGYRIDSSVRPGFDYRAEGGPDFTSAGNHAYRCGPRDSLVELPLSIVYTGHLRRGGGRLHARLGAMRGARGVAARLGLIDRVPLTPEGVPVGEALAAIDRAVDDGQRLLNFSFHSPVAVPGMTPYVRDADDLATFHRWWDLVLDRLDRRGVRPVGEDALLAVLACSADGAIERGTLGACSSMVRAGRS